MTHDDVDTLWELVDRAAARFGPATYLEPFEPALAPVSFADLRRAVGNLAAELDGRGVPQGARVAVSLHNSTLAALLFVGTVAAGRVLVPLNPAMGSEEVDHILGETRPALVLADGRLRRRLGEVRSAPIDYVDDDPAVVARLLSDNGAPVPTVAPGDAEIVYTSGSTGRPKGVVLSHRSLLADAAGLARLFRLEPGTRFLTVCPLFHNSGQVFTTLTPLWCGGSTTAVRSELAMLRFWELVERFRPDWTLVVNAFLALLAKRGQGPAATTTLRGVLSGGSRLGADLVEDFERLFGVRVFQVYGLTETTSVATCEHPDAQRSVGSAGRPLDVCQVEVVDGEIRIAGSNLFSRYLDRPELTAERLVDGWLRTGDVGYVDDRGNLFVVDRLDSLVIVGGENVYPAEVERVAARFDGIEDLLVTAVPHDVLGCELVLVYQLAPGGRADVDGWRRQLAAALSTFKVPRHMVSIDALGLAEFPRASNGKILRKQVEDRVRRHWAAGAFADEQEARPR